MIIADKYSALHKNVLRILTIYNMKQIIHELIFIRNS